MDDIVVKSRKASDLVDDLEIAFKCLKEKGIKLNPEKCVFGGPPRHALGIHNLEARHQGQPREGLGRDQHGTNPRPQGSVEGYGMPCGTEPLHLAPW